VKKNVAEGEEPRWVVTLVTTSVPLQLCYNQANIA